MIGNPFCTTVSRRTFLEAAGAAGVLAALAGSPILAFAETVDDIDVDELRELGPFEISNAFRDLAKKNELGLSPLDAGRGNPNWSNTKSRLAHARLTQFAVIEGERVISGSDMCGFPQQEGIAERFAQTMDPQSEIDAFLLTCVDYCVNELGIDADELLKEFCDAIIGNHYPFPDRCLVNCEKILNAFFENIMYAGTGLKDSSRVFPVEGGSAAMCYLFNMLRHNRVLNPGDTIAIATPIFTPYLQFPDLSDFQFVPVKMECTATNDWDIPEEQFEVLKDPSVKSFFLVNPSNPAARALSDRSLELLKEAVAENPDLLIITDDVYGTFVDGFRSAYGVAPYNTVLVYSYSKLYGATGCRVGAIVMNDNNVVDKLLGELPEEDKKMLDSDYAIVTSDVRSFPAIERICADSRDIVLYHTSGLSTPMQVLMVLMSLTHLVCDGADPYIEQANQTVRHRHALLMESLGLPTEISPLYSQYYQILSLSQIAAGKYDEAFGEWVGENVDTLAFLLKLAATQGVVLMFGPGFGAPSDTMRASLANLNDEDYVELGRRICEQLETVHEEYLKA